MVNWEQVINEMDSMCPPGWEETPEGECAYDIALPGGRVACPPELAWGQYNDPELFPFGPEPKLSPPALDNDML